MIIYFHESGQNSLGSPSKRPEKKKRERKLCNLSIHFSLASKDIIVLIPRRRAGRARSVHREDKDAAEALAGRPRNWRQKVGQPKINRIIFVD